MFKLRSPEIGERGLDKYKFLCYLENISHLRCGPVGVRFTRLPDGGQVESRFAGRHKCLPARQACEADGPPLQGLKKKIPILLNYGRKALEIFL